MIGWHSSRGSDETDTGIVKLRSFDDFEFRLGDMMRGERATMGKSLLDVQRELRIKAAYIAAIENSDPTAFDFDTVGFISGYVRSYARYLSLDPDETFQRFCDESGFTAPHGMLSDASFARKRTAEERLARKQGIERDPFTSPNTPFVPAGESFWESIEPRAIGSTLVLVGLIAGIGYGGWTLLKEVQQVRFAPVEQTPVVLSDLDPLTAAVLRDTNEIEAPRADALDRLYRPQALDVPVLVARDAPIATLDPNALGSFRAPSLPNVQIAEAQEPVYGPQLPASIAAQPVPQVLEEAAPTLRIVTVRPSWVRVRAADGTVIYEGIMEGGQDYEVPATEEPPTLRSGESGAVYFAVGDQHFGPVGAPGSVTSNVALSVASVTETFAIADLAQDNDLARMVAEAQPLGAAETAAD